MYFIYKASLITILKKDEGKCINLHVEMIQR